MMFISQFVVYMSVFHLILASSAADMFFKMFVLFS